MPLPNSCPACLLAALRFLCMDLVTMSASVFDGSKNLLSATVGFVDRCSPFFRNCCCSHPVPVSLLVLFLVYSLLLFPPSMLTSLGMFRLLNGCESVVICGGSCFFYDGCHRLYRLSTFCWCYTKFVGQLVWREGQ